MSHTPRYTHTPPPYTTLHSPCYHAILGDQEGTMSYWKRLHANPFKPWCCPVLALGVHVLCITPADQWTNRVFTTTTGDLFRSRFSKFMTKAFPDGKVEDLPIHRVTSHSPKRGGICMASGNEVVKWEAVELRADHKCGLTSSYQTCAAPQQDGIMGRLFAGLEFGSEEFNVAPPHFRPEDVLQIPFDDFLTHYASYHDNFKAAIPFLIASVVFHIQNGNLQKVLPRDHPFWGSTFVMRHRQLCTSLGTKVVLRTPPSSYTTTSLFVQILGGKVGAVSILKVTGNSVIGDMRSDITDIRTNVHAIKGALAVACASAGQGLASAGPPVVPILPNVYESLQQQLNSIHDEIIGMKRKLHSDFSDVVAASSGRAEANTRRCVPVFYLSNTFKLHSCTPSVLLTRWVTPEPPAPAWRHIRNEMLPRIDGRRAQECLLTTYNSFMQAFLGRNPNIADVESNIDEFFHVAWTRMATEYGWPENTRSSARTVKTVYGWLLQRPALMQKLKDSKLIVPDAFQIRAAIRARDLRELARFNSAQADSLEQESSQMREQSASEVKSLHHTPPHTIMHHHRYPHAPCSLQCSLACRLFCKESLR